MYIQECYVHFIDKLKRFVIMLIAYWTFLTEAEPEAVLLLQDVANFMESVWRYRSGKINVMFNQLCLFTTVLM